VRAGGLNQKLQKTGKLLTTARNWRLWPLWHSI
jgi:hypothetical protein